MAIATMEEATIREALSTVGQYLSDTIAPLQASESVSILLDQPAALMAEEIISWIPAQYQGNDGNASVADYLFHAVSKLHNMVHLKLIPEKRLTPYLQVVKQLLLDYCPAEDRRILHENFERLGTSEAALAAPVTILYRQMGSGGTSEIREQSLSDDTSRRRLSILWDRLKSEVRQPAARTGAGEHAEVLTQLIAAAASDARSGEEFRRFQENLKSLGIDSGTDHIFRSLSRSLPGWMISTEKGALKSHNPAIEAMSQIIRLTEDRWEGCKRFQDMVQAAIEQFNSGSLARAATMFDLALSVGSDSKLDPAAVANVRRTAHESLDANRLRTLAGERDKHHLLRKVLVFFDELTVKNLLDSLEKEQKRERRRLLLRILEAHGDDARKAAFERLKELLATTDVANDWYFARNLVCLLHGIPNGGEIQYIAELELVAPLLKPSLPAPLVREAITYAGQLKCGGSEGLLISMSEELEKIAFECDASGKDPAQWKFLLDRTIFTLAHYGTSKAYAAVVKHGLSRCEELGDTLARLGYLAGQDLSTDQETLGRLLRFLKSKTPRKVLGLTIQKNEQIPLHVIKALSTTPAPAVRQMFAQIATQFPETKFGQAASRALKEFGELDKPGAATERLLSGDLDLFGLPDLLQQLNLLQVSGTLSLKDARGDLVGTFSLRSGRMLDCIAGRLTGKNATYQLLEKPVAGTFVFQGRRDSVSQDKTEAHKLPDLNSILFEGMRRYDEMQRACAIVPDFALVKRKGPEPVTRDDEENVELFYQVWTKTADGTTPEECEASCLADSYSVRVLLARWVEEEVLTIE